MNKTYALIGLALVVIAVVVIVMFGGNTSSSDNGGASLPQPGPDDAAVKNLRIN